MTPILPKKRPSKKESSSGLNMSTANGLLFSRCPVFVGLMQQLLRKVLMENSSHCDNSYELGLFAIFGLISLQFVVVGTHPLELDIRGVGINQREPSYLPTYNGIFSIHALNYTHTASGKMTENYIHQENSDPNSPTDSLATETFPSLMTFPQTNETSGDEFIQKLDESATNDVELKDYEILTQPRIQVVTMTIDDEPQTSEKNVAQTFAQESGTESSFDNTSETLMSGGSKDETLDAEEAENDIFDGLMDSIQNHWLDFVGKMKLSVLDVWKSMSEHMMDRLQNFATSL